MPGCVRQPEGLAGAVLGRLALGAVPCQQAARGIRRAAYARHPRQLRRHPPAPDVHHLPPLLRTDARFRRARRVPVRGGDADLRRAFAAAVVRAHLAVHQQLRDGDHRLAALLVLAAEGVGRAGGSGEHRVKRVSLRGYAVGRNFRRCLFRLKGLSQMALLELGGKRFTIPVGEVTLGSDASCAISLSGAAVLPRHALLQGQADGQVIIRKVSPAADVLINGVRLGAEPTPLLHGDKVEVGGHELTFVDERRSGSTQFVKAFTPATAAGPAKAGGKPPAIGVTGGRVVSLTDGREYVIAAASLVFGREAGCDVVVPGKDVSRRHAEIVLTPKGYVLVDSSTNGTFVNEERVEGQRILARADVLRLGDEQFRFYVDAAPATAAAPPPPGPAANPPQVAPPASAAASQVGAPGPAAPPPGAADRLRHTVHGLEAFVPAGGALASFLVRSGGLIGQRLAVKTPIVNIGRADYNDLVVPDPSISTSHAKLQRREGVWVLVDLDSTNGTFVDGERVKGEAPLAPGATVRLGDVQLVFEPSDDALSIAKGGGTQMLRTPHSTAFNAPPRPASPPSQPPASPSRPSPPSPASPAPGAKPAPPLRPPPPTPSRPGPRPKRPAAQQPPPKKGKGCGGSAAALVVGGGAIVALLHRLLA